MTQKTIWKFPLLKNDIEMPLGAEILTVQLQGGCPTLWAIVRPDSTPIIRHFRIVMTGGENYNEGDKYIGTTQAHGIVLHIFETDKPSGT